MLEGLMVDAIIVIYQYIDVFLLTVRDLGGWGNFARNKGIK